MGLLGRPATIEGRLVLGQALQALERYDEVVAEMRVVLDLDSSTATAVILTAEALLRKGDTEAGMEALHRAQRLAPDDPAVQRLLEETERRPGTASEEVTTQRPPFIAAPLATPSEVSGLIELDPEVEGVEIREDSTEAVKRRGFSESRGAPPAADIPISPLAPGTMMLPPPPARRTIPPPLRTTAPPLEAAKPELRSAFPQTLALSSPFDQPRRPVGPTSPNGPPSKSSVPSTLALHVEPPMSAAQQQQAAEVAKLFADPSPSRSSSKPASASASEAARALNTTLAGLGGAPSGRGTMIPPAVPSGPPVVAASRPRVAMWIAIGIFLISAGLFTGFQIRAVRLDKQIAAARERTRDLDKSDTWSGWTAAVDGLSAIVTASSTVENRASLARARALVAFEFGDRLSDAEKAVASLAGGGGLEGKVAASYLALARSDGAAAKQLSAAALAEAGTDPAALYVASQAALLEGDVANAMGLGKRAFEKSARPLYGVGLARAYASAHAWDEALSTLDAVLAGQPEHLDAIIERSTVLAASGRIGADATVGKDIRAKLEKLMSQPRSASRSQMGFGHLAMARIDFARNDLVAARNDVQNAAQVGLDEQRFAEQAVETLVALGEVGLAQKAATSAQTSWPGSKRVRLAVAQMAILQGRMNDALQTCKQADLATLPIARAIMGQARLALADIEGARGDFDAALKVTPKLEPALVGRAWLEIATNQPGEASKRIAERAASGRATPAVMVVYAAGLRTSTDPVRRDQARQLLEKLVAGPLGPDVVFAQLELARAYRDSGDFASAGKAYGEARARGSREARLEAGQLAIDDRDPKAGAATLNALLKDSGTQPSTVLLLEVARARMLSGDHGGASQALESAAKAPGSLSWKLDRERGRLALRRGDVKTAISALTSALEGSKSDPETLLIAADAASAGASEKLAESVGKLASDRLGESPEASIVRGKLLLAAGNIRQAEAAYLAGRNALKAQNAAPRRLAQANFGLAVIAYARRNDPDALAKLNLVINDDPSIYDAYLFKADIIRDRNQALEQARIAIQYNPDYPRAWFVLGKSAAALGDKATLADALAKLQTLAADSPELKELASLSVR
jgi:predicted Zn-dependent protease